MPVSLSPSVMLLLLSTQHELSCGVQLLCELMIGTKPAKGREMWGCSHRSPVAHMSPLLPQLFQHWTELCGAATAQQMPQLPSAAAGLPEGLPEVCSLGPSQQGFQECAASVRPSWTWKVLPRLLAASAESRKQLSTFLGQKLSWNLVLSGWVLCVLLWWYFR